MAVLEAAELDELQIEMAEVFDEVYPDRASLTRGATETINPDAPDERTQVANVINEDFPCKYRASNGRERMIADQPQGALLFTVTVPATIRARQGDVLTIKAKGVDPEYDRDMVLSVLAPLPKSNMIKLELVCQQSTGLEE